MRSQTAYHAVAYAMDSRDSDTVEELYLKLGIQSPGVTPEDFTTAILKVDGEA